MVRRDANGVMGLSLLTIALLGPATLAPSSLWAQVLMAAQIIVFAWVCLARGQVSWIDRLGRTWPDRLADGTHLVPAGVRWARVMGLVVTSLALITAAAGHPSFSRLMLAIAVTSAVTNLFLRYCVACDLSRAVMNRRSQ